MAKRRPKKFVKQIICILTIIFTIWLLLDVLKDIKTAVLLKRQADLTTKELASLQEENASLTNRKSKLEDPTYVQTYARGEYMFSKNDEKVFYLPKKTED